MGAVRASIQVLCCRLLLVRLLVLAFVRRRLLRTELLPGTRFPVPFIRGINQDRRAQFGQAPDDPNPTLIPNPQSPYTMNTEEPIGP